jgi:hypothetical protein
MKTKIIIGDSVVSLSQRVYGDIGLCYKLIQDNPILVNIQSDLSGLVGVEVVFDSALVVKVQPQLVIKSTANSNVGVYRVLQNQSLLDVCIMVYGNMGYLTKLMVDNNIVGTNQQDNGNKYFKFAKNISVIKQTLAVNGHYGIEYCTGPVTRGKSYNSSFNISFN